MDSIVYGGGQDERTTQKSHDRLERSDASFANPTDNIKRIGIKEGWRVADLGSGSGMYTLALAKQVGPEGDVYAVDVQRDLLTRIDSMAKKAEFENVHISWGDLEEVDGIHIRDGFLDMALISNTLFQIDDKNRLLQEAWRILKPTGILAIIDWKDSYNGIGPKQKDVVSPTTAVVLITDNGFAMKKQFDAGENHYGLVCAKIDTRYKNNEIKKTTAEKTKQDDFIKRTVGQEII